MGLDLFGIDRALALLAGNARGMGIELGRIGVDPGHVSLDLGLVGGDAVPVQG